MNPITLFLVIACALAGLALGKMVDIYLAPPFLVAAVIIALSLKMANAWQKFVILRAGKLQGVKGPGLFLIFPIIDNVTAVIDERIQTTAFNAEQALTKDTVPVNVDAIIFWHARACAFPCRFHDTNRLIRASAASVPGGGGLRLKEPYQAGP